MSRGLRNHNPLNIRLSHEIFDGEVTPSTDTEFKQFQNNEYGYRAAFKILMTYNINGCRTIRNIISRWAPGSENDTESYISIVVQKTGINPSANLSWNQKTYCSIVSAMSFVENGIAAVADEVEKGFNLL